MKSSIFRVAALLTLISLIGVSCSQNEITGVVQNSQLTQEGYELSVGTGGKPDYVLVETKALVDLQAMRAMQKDNSAILTFGN